MGAGGEGEGVEAAKQHWPLHALPVLDTKGAVHPPKIALLLTAAFTQPWGPYSERLEVSVLVLASIAQERVRVQVNAPPIAVQFTASRL